MTVESQTTIDHIHTSLHPNDRPIRRAITKTGRFTLHLLEMVLAMLAGMPIFVMLESLVPASSPYSAAFESGTLYDFTHAVFMTVPMVAWMIVRRHGIRHSAEMAIAMLAPVAVSVALRQLGAEAYLPWISDAGHVAMFLGMILAMLYRREHYTVKAGRSAHTAHHKGGEQLLSDFHNREYKNIGDPMIFHGKSIHS